jgi:hypothetical protein
VLDVSLLNAPLDLFRTRVVISSVGIGSEEFRNVTSGINRLTKTKFSPSDTSIGADVMNDVIGEAGDVLPSSKPFSCVYRYPSVDAAIGYS